MMTNRAEVLQDLRKVINAYRLEDIKKTVLLYLTDIRWKDIQKQITKSGLSFTSKNVSNAIYKLLESKNTDLTQIVYQLELIGVSLTNRRIWCSYILHNAEPVTHLNCNDIGTQIFNALKRNGRRGHVNVYFDSGKYWISVAERKIVRKVLKLQAPIFFVMFVYQDYLFCSKKNLDPLILNSVVTGLGYTKCKDCNLTGRFVDSLLTILKDKDKVHNKALVSQDVQFRYGDGRKMIHGVDFSQFEQRRRYANEAIGEKPPTLERISFKTENAKFLSGLNEIEPFDFDMTLTLRSRNIYETVKDSIEKNLIPVPMPLQLKKIRSLGKNNIILRAND